MVSTGKRQARTPTNVWFGVANVFSVGSRRIKCKKKAQREKEGKRGRRKMNRKMKGGEKRENIVLFGCHAHGGKSSTKP